MRCDWNPQQAAPAERVAVPIFGGGLALMDEQRGCKGKAVWRSAYGGAWLNLCDRCMRLPVFSNVYSRRQRIETQKLVNER